MRSARKQVKDAKDSSLLALEQLSQFDRVDTRYGDMCANAVNNQCAEQKPQAAPEIPELAGFPDCRCLTGRHRLYLPLSGCGDVRHGAAGGLDRCASALGGSNALQGNLAAELAGENDLGRKRISRDDASLLKHQ